MTGSFSKATILIAALLFSHSAMAEVVNLFRGPKHVGACSILKTNDNLVSIQICTMPEDDIYAEQIALVRLVIDGTKPRLLKDKTLFIINEESQKQGSVILDGPWASRNYYGDQYNYAEKLPELYIKQIKLGTKIGFAFSVNGISYRLKLSKEQMDEVRMIVSF